MPRIRALLLGSALAAVVFAQQQKAPPPKPQEPAEEDEALLPKTDYSFNPLQAEKEIKVGSFYFKKGSYKAAATRFQEATKWNPGLADAWFRLGEAQERLKDKRAAEEAYRKFIELAPEDRRAQDLKKTLSGKR